MLTNKRLLKPLQLQETFHFIAGEKNPEKQKLIKIHSTNTNNKYLPLIKGMLFVIPILDTFHTLFYLKAT